MTDRHLVVLLGGAVAGGVTRSRDGKLAFAYDREWLQSDMAMPVSLSLPLEAAQHPGPKIEAFIWGLLPDNELVLAKWGRQFHVSARSPFSLIANVGEDCAGAVQFVRWGRLDDPTFDAPRAEWLTEHDVAERLRALRRDETAMRLPRDTGQFSLAGAQAKTALLLHERRWGVPSGRLPTTHILKPPSDEFDGHAENEHFCLVLARALNLPAAQSEVRRFDGEVAIVVERYDRTSTSRGVVRVHQEDMCQALGVMPTSKYQNEGGPTPADIVGLLRRHSSNSQADVDTFVQALAFNWLIGGTDAHAKNYSLLHAPGGRVRLAPLYDIASALPYDHLDERRLKLAMKIGREYFLARIGPRQWMRAEQELSLPEGSLLRGVRRLGHDMLTAIPDIARRLRNDGLRHPIVGRLETALMRRAERCLRELDA
jgi:serine/threonine-protein kinase HipA